jgi:hypothetical protein
MENIFGKSGGSGESGEISRENGKIIVTIQCAQTP